MAAGNNKTVISRYCINLLPFLCVIVCQQIVDADTIAAAATSLEATSINVGEKSANVTTDHIGSDIKTTEKDSSYFFLHKLFDKYGKNGVMTFEGFEHLLESIGLGRLVVFDHDHHNQEFTPAAVLHREEDFSAGASSAPQSSSSTSPSLSASTFHPEPTNLTKLNESASHEHELVKNVSEVDSSLSTSSNKFSVDFNSSGHVHSFLDYISVNQCLTVTDMFRTFDINLDDGTISMNQFIKLCPAIVYELDEQRCSGGLLHNDDVLHVDEENEKNSALVWAYATAAVVVISLSGLLVVAVIPIIYGSFYQLLLQFLVALAVGSLIGDALLHLLPHALSTDHHHHHHHKGQHVHHHHPDGTTTESNSVSANTVEHHTDIMVWKGLVAVTGILLFFMAERLLTVISTRRKRNSEAQTPSQMKMLKDEVESSRTVGEKLCKHKYNSYGYSYGDVTMDMLQGLNECEDKDHHNCLEMKPETNQNKEVEECVKVVNGGNGAPTNGDGDHFVMAPATRANGANLEVAVTNHAENNGVIVTQHQHRHHGHSHTHTHTVPASVSAVAWMVIMGDGLHNFSDGLAIGAAFANGITGGLSTSIAVFCHELPHELGDFAVLLKSGMTAKQALMYNGLSSVLCFLGMLLGVALGNVASVSTWIFAGAAGMFVYIALVDMIPELNSTPTLSTAQETDPTRLAIQFLGMVIGVSIMLLIALYEHDLRSIISE